VNNVKTTASPINSTHHHHPYHITKSGAGQNNNYSELIVNDSIKKTL